jgi:hypothetical protein
MDALRRKFEEVKSVKQPEQAASAQARRDQVISPSSDGKQKNRLIG